MGDETTEFASRFSGAVAFLRGIAAPGAEKRAPAQGPELAAAIRQALDAIEAVYATETGAVRDWPEQRRRVLARLAAVRTALDASASSEDLRREVGSLVLLLDPGRPGANAGVRGGRQGR